MNAQIRKQTIINNCYAMPNHARKYETEIGALMVACVPKSSRPKEFHTASATISRGDYRREAILASMTKGRAIKTGDLSQQMIAAGMAWAKTPAISNAMSPMLDKQVKRYRVGAKSTWHWVKM